MISLKEVSKKFGNKLVIDNISLTIKPGITFIVGSSGAGKSTLLNLIGGLDTPSSGSISYQGNDIATNLASYRGEKVGFVFQDFNLISGLSVKKNIELGLLYSKHKENISKIDSQIAEFEIKDADQSVETLSGGEKQRVAVIRSICKESDIILADEPTGNLDLTNSHIVYQSLVNMKQDKYIVVVSHDLEMARKYGDRVITMSDGKIIHDSDTEETMVGLNEPSLKSIPSNSKKTNWSTIFMLGYNSLTMRMSKILSIALVISLTISALAILFSFNNIGNNVSKSVNVNYLESDLISIFYPATGNMGYKATPFELEDMEYIKNTYKTNSIVPVYTEGKAWFFSNQNLTKEAIIKQINMDKVFEERIMSYDIDGEFIQNENDIILAEDVAKALFDDSGIGKKVALHDGSGESIVFTVVGINKTVNPFDEIYSIVSSIKIKELLELELNSALENRMELDEFKEEKLVEPINVTTGGIYGPMKIINGSEDCIYGRLSENKNEIIISTALFQYALSGLNLQYESSDIDVENDTIPEELIEELTSKKIALKHNGLFEVYITGVYESDQIEMKFQESLVSDLKEIQPTVIEAYLPQTSNVREVKEKINNSEKFTCFLQLENLKNNISRQTSYFKWVIILTGLIMTLVSIAMLSSFFKIVVLERKKEVAILKSLGATDTEVLYTLLYDTFIISIISVLLSFILTGTFLLVLPHILTDMSFARIQYPYVTLIILGISFAVFVCFYTIKSLKKIIRKTPADLFKQ